MIRIAMVGFPGSGKSSAWRAVCGLPAGREARPGREAVGTADVPDPRIDRMVPVFEPVKITRARTEWIDLPALFGGVEPGALLEIPRGADLLAAVVGGYRGTREGLAEAEGLAAEWLLRDLEIVERRLEKLETEIRKPTPDRDERVRERDVLSRARERLTAEQRIDGGDWDPAARRILGGFGLLSMKPVLWIWNGSEGESAPPEGFPKSGITMSARAEAEIDDLDEADRAPFREEMGLPKTPAADRLPPAAMEAAGRIVFFTGGRKELRAWDIPGGSDAVAAAGAIHTEIAAGFVRAEIYDYDDLADCGFDPDAVKKAGRIRMEGKGYVVDDGDILLIHAAGSR